MSANRLGLCSFSLKDAVSSEKLKPYRDTSGITPGDFQKVLAICDRYCLKGKRDFALLWLLWSNALRRNEVSLLNLENFERERGRLWITGKGHNEKQGVDISPKTCQAIGHWLEHRGLKGIAYNSPLFIALDAKSAGHRLTGDGIYKIVRRYCEKAGIAKQMSPHRIRHSSITTALDKSQGNVRKAHGVTTSLE
jgi:integrase/recombinase XerC